MKNDTYTYTLWVCAECLMMHANGETGGDPDREPLGLLDNCVTTLGLVYEEHECGKEDDPDLEIECECDTQEFSSSRCEGCGSALGGSRHALTMWTEEENA